MERTKFARAIARMFTPQERRDIANHGADSGWSGITYTTDCVALYEKHEDEIWDMLSEDADSMGYPNAVALTTTFKRSDMLNDPAQFKNLLLWYAVERVCQQEQDEAEATN